MGVWGRRGGTLRTQGVCLCLCRSPQGARWMVEVNESDWLPGVFLLLLQFAHSQGFVFFISPSWASAQLRVKDKVVGEINQQSLLFHMSN